VIPDADDFSQSARRRSLFALVGELPALIVDLVRIEIERFKAELSEKGQRIGIGVGLMVVAAVFAFFGAAVLIACAVLALALVLPAWLAALLVAAVLFLLALLLIFIGRGRIQAGLASSDLDVNLGRDVDAFKGEGAHDRNA
jgi:uncharacterized membrane protein YqjE